ncbi:MAG: HAMP domain-containing histidine kinase [Phycisphaeraceae bacterium]|nr:HAMP domain-containing histidine kinase [Phycisphaeraceae bacterium]
MPSFHRSLRFRLILMFVLIFGLFQITLSAIALLARERHLRSYFDHELTLRTQNMAAKLVASQQQFFAPTLARAISEESKSIYFREFYAQLIDDEGRAIARSENLDGYQLPFGPRESAAKRQRRELYETLAGQDVQKLAGHGQTLRMVTLHVNDSKVEPFYLQVAARLEHVNQSITFLRLLLAVGTPVGLLVAAMTSWLVAGHAIRQIDAVSNLMRQVTPGDLSRRLAVGHPSDEIGRMVRHVNDMLDRLEAGFRAQECFIQDASHELKTPLSALLTEAQVLKLSPPSTRDFGHFLDSAEEELRHLGRLVASLLLLTQMDAKDEMTRRAVYVNDVVVAAAQEGQPLARQRGVEVTLKLPLSDDDHDDEPVCQGDEQLLVALVSNLIRNAIRFSPVLGEVAVTLTQTPDAIRIDVGDEGPGIPEAVMQRIFDRFAQAPQPDPRRGTGLGLSIARNIAELHGGTLHVANREPRGAVFSVTLPREQTPSSAT